jgi:hypothetical protein
VCIEGLRGSTDIPFLWDIVQRRFKLTMLEKEIQRGSNDLWNAGKTQFRKKLQQDSILNKALPKNGNCKTNRIDMECPSISKT